MIPFHHKFARCSVSYDMETVNEAFQGVGTSIVVKCMVANLSR